MNEYGLLHPALFEMWLKVLCAAADVDRTWRVVHRGGLGDWGEEEELFTLSAVAKPYV